MPNALPHLLIFEPDPRGHTPEWIEHIQVTAAALRQPPKITFVVASALAEALTDRAARSNQAAASQINVLSLTKRELDLCHHRLLAVSGFARWWIVRRYLRLTGANRVLFLALDHLTLPLGLGLGLADSDISGILFRPSVHYPTFGTYRPGFKERLRDARKGALYRGMLNNRAVHTVFSLDPYFPAYAAARYRSGDKVVALGDPAHPAPQPTTSEQSLASTMPNGRRAFVLFGEITERKGILPLLAALLLLPSHIAQQVALTIAGRIDPGLQRQVEESLAQVRRVQPSLWIHVENRRLAEGEVTALVQRSDFVLAPYQRFVGSSGVLLWAAQLGKPVISQDYGLVGQLTREHGLGLAIDTSDPRTIAHAIVTAVEHGAAAYGDAKGMHDFTAAQRPDDFATSLLGAAV
jgi:glycosyltransferase involved in cell wall biosynthesis